ncbi:MAG: hypothetical protein A2X17_08480 [Bacteroidetes bacterium GWF2_41_61]|nr:MAG: hypothetical protein A2X17_08480 [Bacteroidetes bacterium GWF2_41_61]
MNFNLIYNSSRTGYMQELSGTESYIESLFREPIERWRREGINKKELQDLYADVDEAITGAYLSLSVKK